MRKSFLSQQGAMVMARECWSGDCSKRERERERDGPSGGIDVCVYGRRADAEREQGEIQ
jgi:hypothetical protein